MKSNLFKFFALLFAMGLFIVSCEELGVETPELDTDAAQDNALSERAVSDVFTAVKDGSNLGKSASSCPEVIFEVSSQLLTLNYGETGCMGADGITRSGIVTATFTNFDGWLNGTSAVVSFDNFKINGKPLTGVITITSNLVGDAMSYTVEATDMVLTYSDQSEITWSSSSIVSWVKYTENGNYWRINGEANGVSRKGINFSRTSEDLLTDPTCKWFVGGTLTLTTENVTDVLTFTECEKVSIKHNNLPAIVVTLN